MNHTRHMILVPEYTFERLQQRQQILTPPVTQTLKNLDNEMSDILSSKQLDDEAKATLDYKVLQRYLTYYDQRKGQPLHVKLTTLKPVETPKPEESEETSKESPAETETIPSSAIEPQAAQTLFVIYIRDSIVLRFEPFKRMYENGSKIALNSTCSRGFK